MKRRGLVFLAVFAMFVASASLSAQSSTTGSITGSVSDTEGTDLPGATVTALHNPTGRQYVVTTQADGRFAIGPVRVGGPYTVSVAMDGFTPQVASNISVSLGSAAQLSFELPSAEFSDTVTVVGEATFINRSRTGAASNVGTEALESLPTIARSLNDFARTNPFITVGGENEDSEAISIAGRSGRMNNLQIDGSVNNDLFGLSDSGTPAGRVGSTPISLDAIQEVQLVLAEFDVRQGGFSGGSINAVTRSGSNNWEGSLFYFTRDNSNFGDGPAELGALGEFSEDQYGFRLGGPLSQDKAFFFINADIEERTTPTGWSIDGSSGQTFGFVDEANRFRQILADRYGYDPGGLGENIKDNPSDKYFARVDVNLNNQNSLTVRHNFVDAGDDTNRPNGFTFEFSSETYAEGNETNSTVAQLDSTISSTMFNEARFASQTIEDRRAPRDLPLFPWIEIENIAGRGSGEFEAGSDAFSGRNSLDQDLIEFTNDFTWLKGDHTITLGTHNEFFGFDNLFIQNALGAYEFDTLDDFENGIVEDWNYTEVNPGQSDTQKFDVQQIGLYAGDSWRVRDDVTITYGLRIDAPFFPDSPTFNPTTVATYGFDTSEMPDGEMLVQPRFGFNWDVNGDARSQLRGGLGIFAGRSPYVWISNQYGRTGIEQTFYKAANVPFIADPFGQAANIGAGARPTSGEFNFIDPNFKFPTLARYNLAYDRQLPWGLNGSVELVYSDSLEEIAYQRADLEQVGTTFYGAPEYSRVVGGDAYLITNSSEGDATNIAVKLEKPSSGSPLSWFVSYAFGESNTVNDGSSSRAVSNFNFNEQVDPQNPQSNTSDWEVENRINASVSYTFNQGSAYSTLVSAFYNVQSGRPFSWMMGSDFFNFGFGASVNGDRSTGNDLFWVPATANDVELRGGTWEQLNAFIEADSCLSSHRGSIAPRNCSNAPTNHTLDLHIAQSIPVKGVNLQITWDVLNLMNLIDEDSGVLRYVNFNAERIVEVEGVNAAGKPIYTLFRQITDPENNPIFDLHSINSRWKTKFGVRVSF